MGGCRCSYKNCTNTTKTRDNLHFFHYPVKQKDRCRQWIENANKPQFYDLDEDQLRNKVVCETHFENCFFPNMQKKRLLQGAIPTLEGDCEPKPLDRSLKIQDVQVLPANADGTIFLLETNMQNHQMERVESYIYTNNGQVLPINKCNENMEDSMQTIFSEGEIEEIGGIKPKYGEPEVYHIHSENRRVDKEFETFVEVDPIKVTSDKIAINHYQRLPQKNQRVDDRTHASQNVTDDEFSKTVGITYIKKIKQHSKDIAIIKRILKSRRPCRRPTNSLILNTLKRQIPPSLFSLVNLNLTDKCEYSPEDLEFFSTIHSTSPQVYQILSEKYKWKMPSRDLFNNKNNGHVHSENNS